jgi:hypothetical protein
VRRSTAPRAGGKQQLTHTPSVARRRRRTVVRAFISFAMEDERARNFLVAQARNKKNDLEFTDYSVREPFDEKWKTNCRQRIAQTRGTIVLVGKDTAKSEAVIWEITETDRQGHPMFGIRISPDHTYPLPKGLKSAIRWDIDNIVAQLERWAAR